MVSLLEAIHLSSEGLKSKLYPAVVFAQKTTLNCAGKTWGKRSKRDRISLICLVVVGGGEAGSPYRYRLIRGSQKKEMLAKPHRRWSEIYYFETNVWIISPGMPLLGSQENGYPWRGGPIAVSPSTEESRPSAIAPYQENPSA